MLNTFTHTFARVRVALATEGVRYLDCAGGTRSGKTFSILQAIVILAKSDHAPTLTSVVSETMPHLKRGAIRDFRDILEDEWDEDAWSKVDNIYTFPSGSRVEFFSADQPQKIHGAARDRLFINEAVNIPYETARQLFVRTRGLIVCDYNPTHSFWIHEHIAPRENCVSICSTYRDNGYLPPEQVAEIESNRDDAAWWRVYGEGKVGALDGLIFPDFAQEDALPEGDGWREVYGMDFGFTNDPTVLVHLKIHTGRKEIHARQVFYRTGMLNDAIADAMRAEGIARHTPVIADCAEPKTIADLRRYGYNVQPCYKATRKAEQLQWLKGWRLTLTKDSVDGIRELRGYIWAKDRDGRTLNEPIAVNDHFCDAMRYAAFTTLNGAYSGDYLVR